MHKYLPNFMSCTIRGSYTTKWTQNNLSEFPAKTVDISKEHYTEVQANKVLSEVLPLQVNQYSSSVLFVCVLSQSE